MNKLTHFRIIVPAAILAVASCTAWAVQGAMTVALDDSTISTDVQVIKGRPYVPLSDMAKALGLSVTLKGNTYRLARNGTTGQSGSIPAKLGADIFSRDWGLKVFSAEQVDSYSQVYGPERDPVTLQQAGDVLIVVKCRLRNRSKETQEVYFDKNSAGNTTLTDDNEHGFTPTVYDTRNTDYSSNKMLAGSVHDFAVVFSVPNGTRFKDLVYTVAASGQEKNTDFRISLKP